MIIVLSSADPAAPQHAGLGFASRPERDPFNSECITAMADNEEGPEPAGRAEEHYNNDDQNGAISNPVSMMLYFEACMRNHAAAYANAAAGAAQAAAHAAVAYHHRANSTGMSPMHGGPPMMVPTHFYPLPCPPVMGGPPHFLVPVFPGVVPVLPPQFSASSPPLPLLSPPLPPQLHNNNKGEYRSKRERTRFSGRRRVRSDNDSSSSGGGNSWFRPVKKKATSLIGKTGVTVLFEWASKRQITPTLALKQDAKSFECIVYLPDSSDKGNGCTAPAGPSPLFVLTKKDMLT
jgi:hypothetical protein